MNIIKNSFYIIFGIFVMAILNFIFHIYVGRVLGPVDYGVFGALMALFLLIVLPAGALGHAIAKFTSRFNSSKDYNKINSLRNRLQRDVLIFGAIMLLLIIIFSGNIADYLKIQSSIPVIIVGFTLIFALILPMNRGFLQGMKKFRAYSWNNIIESASRLILVILLLFFGLGVNGAILAYGLAYFVAFLAIFPYIKETKGKNEGLEILKIYKFIFLVLFINLIIQLIINIPTIFIKHYFSSEFTGFWSAALNLARVSLFVTGGISLVMFAEVAGEQDHKNKKKIMKVALLLTLISSIIIALSFIVFGNLAILLLYGKAFLLAVPILKWMGIAIIPISLLQLWINYWLAKKR